MMDKQGHRTVAMKTNIHPEIVETQENWDEQLNLLVGIDSELRHMIEEVQEWEADLLGNFDTDDIF